MVLLECWGVRPSERAQQKRRDRSTLNGLVVLLAFTTAPKRQTQPPPPSRYGPCSIHPFSENNDFNEWTGLTPTKGKLHQLRISILLPRVSAADGLRVVRAQIGRLSSTSENPRRGFLKLKFSIGYLSNLFWMPYSLPPASYMNPSVLM